MATPGPPQELLLLAAAAGCCYWLLLAAAAGCCCWLLVAGCWWLLVAGCWWLLLVAAAGWLGLTVWGGRLGAGWLGLACSPSICRVRMPNSANRWPAVGRAGSGWLARHLPAEFACPTLQIDGQLVGWLAGWLGLAGPDCLGRAAWGRLAWAGQLAGARRRGLAGLLAIYLLGK